VAASSLRQLCPAGSKEVSVETLPVVRKQEKLEHASGTEGSGRSPVRRGHSLPSSWARPLAVGLSSHPLRGAEERLYLQTQEHFQGLVSY